MKNYKIEIISVKADDAAALKEVQKKINQWISTGILKKYEIRTTSDSVIFNILKNKED